MSKTEWGGRHAGKDNLRACMWALLQAEGAAVGDPTGHIPDFVGAEAAAVQLTQTPVWQSARVVKCNPDASQAPVRLHALQEGKVLYMAVPRLRDQRCFVELTAQALQANGVALDEVSTSAGALRHGRLVHFQAMQKIDLVVVGCVAVSLIGGRTGKGAGFADLELGMLRQLRLVQSATPVVTTIHELQIVLAEALPMAAHDSPLDWICTPTRAIATHTTYPRPTGLVWQSIHPEQFESIPVLKSFRPK
jgi:5-formyltetrahydrofolate cyclo-ligase